MKVWLTIYKDGKPVPNGFVCDHVGTGDRFDEERARLDLALYALESVGYEGVFSNEEPVRLEERADRYEAV